MNTLSNLFKDKIDLYFNVVVIAFAAILLLGNSFAPADSIFHFSSFTLSVWGKYICYAVLAISLNLLWGYTGLLCLGQCLFFALGGYAFGMYLMLMSGSEQEVMNTLRLPEIPAFWAPFNSPALAIIAALAVPGIVAFIFGVLAFRSRIKGVYFSILTQALTYAAALLFFRNSFGFGGTNGFTNFKFILGADIQEPGATKALFIASAVLLLAVYGLVSWLLQSKLGKIQTAIRDSENRVRFSGYSTTHFKVFIFVLSAMIAGAAGALYVPQAGIINPSEMWPTKGLDIVVWVALGGRGSKIGPVIGAIVVNFIKSWASRNHPESWVLILGFIFIFVVLFMPNGLVGLYYQIKSYFVKDKDIDDSDSEPAELTTAEQAEPQSH